MNRWVVPAVYCLLFALGCAAPEQSAVKKVNVPVVEPIVGEWTGSDAHLSLKGDNTYRWRVIRRCQAPPCAVDLDKGRYRVKGKVIVLVSSRGYGARTLRFSQAWNPRRLALKGDGRSWTLKFSKELSYPVISPLKGQ